MITVLAALVVFLAAVAGYLVWRAQTAEAADATLEPLNSATASAFMPAQGPDAAVGAPPQADGGSVAGSTPGLFGGTLDNGSCDQDQMSQFLQTHQDKAAAWAEAEGVRPADIPVYVHRLTPVVLRGDTFITNHGFRGGELTSYPAVLEAGTAVLVDGYGTPRVKCYCGNPLSAPPQHRSDHYQGQRWAAFAPVTVIVIRPAPVVIENLTVVNIQYNTVYQVHLPPWPWPPQPGWKEPPSSSSPATTTSTDTSSGAPTSSDQEGPPGVGPVMDCGSSTYAGGTVTVTPAPSCASTTTTTPTTMPTTTTPPTTTTTTTTTTTADSSTTTTAESSTTS